MLEYVADVMDKRGKYNLPVRIQFQGVLAPALPIEKVSKSRNLK
jgi:hypothetical protein